MRMTRFMAAAALVLVPLVAQAQMPSAPAEALDGVDPVVLIQTGKEVQGKAEFKVTRGRFVYLFSTAEAKKTFEAAPDKYEIQMNGACARMGSRAGGNPSDYIVHDGRIYIFGSDDCHKKFAAAPDKFIPKPAPPMPSSAASVEAGRKLLARGLTAMGGADKLDAITTYQESWSQKQKRGDLEATITVKTTWKFPDAVRVDNTVALPDRTMTSATLITPAGAWFIGQGRSFPMSADNKTAAADEINRQLLPLLRSRAEAGTEIAALEPATIDGAKQDRVRIRKGGVDVTVGLDPASGQFRSLAFTGRNMEGEIGAYTLVLGDYRAVNGVSLPFSVRSTFDGQPDTFLARTIESIAINQPVAATVFQPDGK